MVPDVDLDEHWFLSRLNQELDDSPRLHHDLVPIHTLMGTRGPVEDIDTLPTTNLDAPQ